MKKILITTILMSISFLFAGQSEDFYYDRGYEVGYQKGLLKGQEEAFKDAKKILDAYKDRIKAYEIGKYLIESKRLTAPQVYQERNSKNNSIKIVIIPSEIVKELSIDDIFNEFKDLPTLVTTNQEDKTQTDFNEFNSVYLSKRDSSLKDIPDSASRDIKKTVLKVEKSSNAREILNSANVAYVENNSNYEVLFFTEQEKKEFCTQFKKLCK
ncbi:hypothetical protein CRU99_07765 [Malaciobacter mytili]|uniref:hypothetical protein n=1 Tax=Malaciobacter mytili TaxID=603050 RepID=UPI00100A32A4|nr:hypothetical protein [Malaciobacter mytili]RXI43422.1 hypothetical protein CRU99_07765 [Malaciobacter mytili]